MSKRSEVLARAEALIKQTPFSKQNEAMVNSLLRLADAMEIDEKAATRGSNGNAAELRTEESAKELRANFEFAQFLRSPEKRTYAALETDVTPGSLTVGPQWRAQYQKKLVASSGWLTAGATVAQTANGRKYLSFLADDTANMAVITGENQLIDSANAVYSQPSPDNLTFATSTTVSRQLLQDSAFDIGGHLADLFAVRVARRLNLYASTVVGGSGLFASLNAPATAASSSVPTSDELIDMQGSIDPAYTSLDSQPCYMCSPAMRVRLMKQKQATTGAMLYPELKNNMLLGYPLAINVDQSSASGGVAVVFGSIKRAVLVHDVTPHLVTSFERYAEKFLAYYSLSHRLGVTVSDLDAVTALKLA